MPGHLSVTLRNAHIHQPRSSGSLHCYSLNAKGAVASCHRGYWRPKVGQAQACLALPRSGVSSDKAVLEVRIFPCIRSQTL